MVLLLFIQFWGTPVAVGALGTSTGSHFSGRALEDAISVVLRPLIFCSSLLPLI